MITFDHVTKRHGRTVAVDDLSLRLQPGRITGLLGPNGAGKSTTLRMAVGLDRPSAGTVTLDGQAYAALRHPLRHVGALLDAQVWHPGRTAAAHLHVIAASNRIPRSRIETVLGLVGLADVAGRRTRGFSLGMTQRLGIAAAMLGDPATLLLDEPVNGLDPAGVRWLRGLLRGLAAEGRTVCVSSHLMSEMQDTADHVVVMGQGRILIDAPLAQVVARASSGVWIRTPDLAALVPLVRRAGWQVEQHGPDGAVLQGAAAAAVGELAWQHRLRLHELSPRSVSLEAAYLELTAGSVQHPAAAGDPELGGGRG